jgi:cation diffusion facilitator CzcD-associated flavoprotein CzcO
MSHFDVDVLVVGAGFGGCYLLKLLRDQGLSVKLFEAGPTLGGVWCWNRYPGARVDCEFPYYGFSDPAIWKTFTWPERFPDHVELRRYFQHVAKIWDLHKDISLNTQVTAAAWQDDHWLVKTANGLTCKCRWFLAATGTSFKAHVPDWKGIDLFKGEIHHASRWPEHLHLTGKRVAVIGAGSTGLVNMAVMSFNWNPRLIRI